MYDLEWKYGTPQEMIESGRQLGDIIRRDFAALHGPKACMKGIAILTPEKVVVDVRILTIAPNGEADMDEMYDAIDGECVLSPIERLIKETGNTDFLLWTYGDDDDIRDPMVIANQDNAAQALRDTQAVHGIALRGTIFVGRSPGFGAFILSGMHPTPGSPSFMYEMTEHSLKAEKSRPDGGSPIVITAMEEVLRALRDHEDWDEEVVRRAKDVAEERVLQKTAGRRQTTARAASPFDLPELKLPKPEKGLLN
jgi:hypothetical protein